MGGGGYDMNIGSPMGAPTGAPMGAPAGDLRFLLGLWLYCRGLSGLWLYCRGAIFGTRHPPCAAPGSKVLLKSARPALLILFARCSD